MKALYCVKCGSLFNLDSKLKQCKCGKTKGKYINEAFAIYSGETSRIIGIENQSFLRARVEAGGTARQAEKLFAEMGERETRETFNHNHFVAYVMALPETAKRVKAINRKTEKAALKKLSREYEKKHGVTVDEALAGQTALKQYMSSGKTALPGTLAMGVKVRAARHLF